MEKHYSIAEAAQLLGLSQVWLRQCAREGKINAVKPLSPHANYRIAESEILRLLGGR